MQPNNNQFNSTRSFNPPSLPSLSRPVNSATHLSQQQQAPRAQAPQYAAFAQNAQYQRANMNAVHTNNNNNASNNSNSVAQNQQQQPQNQMNQAPINTLSLPSINPRTPSYDNNKAAIATRRAPPPNTGARAPPNTNYAAANPSYVNNARRVHTEYYSANNTIANNNNNPNNRSVAVAIGGSSGAQNNGVQTYTITNIDQDPSRKRGRAGFDPGASAVVAANLNFGAPATKKQRLGDGSAMRMFNTSAGSVASRPQEAIPPPLTYDSNNNINDTNNNNNNNNNGAAAISGQSHGALSSQREWRQSRQSAKFKMAMDILDQFKQNHGGKLPSLRAVMKMLKVGFPKAHEILDAYAAHIGVTKEKLMQDMTVRQEKKRNNNNNQSDSNNRNKIMARTATRMRSNNNNHNNGTIRVQQQQQNIHSANGTSDKAKKNILMQLPHAAIPALSAPQIRVSNNNNNNNNIATASVAAAEESDNNNNNNNVPQNVNKNLQDCICSILRSSQNSDAVRTSSNCGKLENMVSDYEEYYSRLSVNDRLRLAQSYFLLGSMYREANNRNFAYCYVERALSTFRDCNGLAAAAGYKIDGIHDDDDDDDYKDYDNESNSTICVEDIGYFWPQIVEVYILGGHILLSNGQYIDAKEMYQMAHKLADVINKRKLNRDCSTQLTVSEALENLAVVCMYDNDVTDSIKYTQNILSILNSIRDNDKSQLNDCDIRILNARAYYACCLTLSHLNSEKESGYLQYASVLKDAHAKFGKFDERSIGFYCYFAAHFIQIADWKKAQKHLKYILMDCNRKYSICEKQSICDLLNDFITASLCDDDEVNLVVVDENDEFLAQNVEIIHEKHCKFANDVNKMNCNSKKKTIDIIEIILQHLKIFLNFEKYEKAKQIVTNLIQFDEHKVAQLKKESHLLASYKFNENEQIKREFNPSRGSLHVKKTQIERLNQVYQQIMDHEKNKNKKKN